MALMGNDVLEELASRKTDLARDDATREAGRGVVVLGRSGGVFDGGLLSGSVVGAGREGDTRPPAVPFADLLLRRDVVNADGGFVEDVVFEIRREPPADKVSTLASSSSGASLLLLRTVLLPDRTSSS